MPDVVRFSIMIVAAFFAFALVLRFSLRERASGPTTKQLCIVGLIAVVGGMFFARYSHLAFPSLSWGVYYGVPALITVFLPPLYFGMSRREVAQYLPLAWLTAPMIHLFFSLCVGWHDYMPFPVYIPSIAEILHPYLR